MPKQVTAWSDNRGELHESELEALLSDISQMAENEHSEQLSDPQIAELARNWSDFSELMTRYREIMEETSDH